MTLNSRTLNYSLLFSFFWVHHWKRNVWEEGERMYPKSNWENTTKVKMLDRRKTRSSKPLTIRRQLFSGCKRREITPISLSIHHLIDGSLFLPTHPPSFSFLRPDCPVFFFYEIEWGFNNTVEYTHDSSVSFFHYYSALFWSFFIFPPPIIVNDSIFNQIFVYDFVHFLSFNLHVTSSCLLT